MLPDIDTPSFSIYNFDRLAFLHRLFLGYTGTHPWSFVTHLHLRRRLRQVKHPVLDLLERVLAEALAFSVFSSILQSLWMLLREYWSSLLGNCTHLPQSGVWHNFGRA